MVRWGVTVRRDGQSSSAGVTGRLPRAGIARLRTFALTAATLVCFAANSLLCRAALRPRLIDAATFTSIRLVSGAAALALILAMTKRERPAGGSVGSAVALFAYAGAFSLAYVRIGAGVGALLLFGAVQVTMLGWSVARRALARLRRHARRRPARGSLGRARVRRRVQPVVRGRPRPRRDARLRGPARGPRARGARGDRFPRGAPHVARGDLWCGHPLGNRAGAAPAVTARAWRSVSRFGAFGSDTLSRLLLPPTAERAVDPDQGLELPELCLRERELRREMSRVAVEHLQVARGTALVPHARQVGGILGRVCQLFLLDPELPALAISHQRVGHIPERQLHGMLVGEVHFLRASLGERDPVPDPATFEHRLGGACAEGPGPRGPGEETAQGGAQEPTGGGQ